MIVMSLRDVQNHLRPDYAIVAGGDLPYPYAQKIWAAIVTAQAEGFDCGYKVAMRTVIARMKELGSVNVEYDSIIFHNLAKEFENIK